MDGVEHNISSRFVDYSIASPWENLVAEIEKVISKPTFDNSKTNVSSRIKFDHSYYYMTLYDDEDVQICKTINSLFGINKFFLLTRERSTVDTPSQRRLIFSALVTAADASSPKVPIFFASSPIVHESREILGYDIERVKTLSRCYIRHFESTLQYGISPQHKLSYVDGLTEIFVEITEQHTVFDCSSIKDIAIDREQSLESTDDSLRISWPDYLRSSCKHLAAKKALPKLLRSLSIELTYGSGLTAASVVDNEERSSLFPSLQPPDSWRIHCKFFPSPPPSPSPSPTPLPTSQKEGSSSEKPRGGGGSVADYRCSLGDAVRRLLGLVVAGRVCRTGSTVARLTLGLFAGEADSAGSKVSTGSSDASSRKEASNIVIAPAALDSLLIKGLSSPSAEIVQTMCSSEYDSNSRATISQLVEEVFAADGSDLLLPPSPHSSKPGVVGLEENTKHDEETSSGQLLFLTRIALAATRLSDLASVAYFWTLVVKEVRARWESGEPLPLPTASPKEHHDTSVEEEHQQILSLPLQSLWGGMKRTLLSAGRGGLFLPSVALPRHDTPVIDQKIQMIQLCTFLRAGGEDLVTECPDVWLAGQLDNSLPIPPAILEAASMRDEPLDVAEEGAALPSFIPPRLQLRLPLTSDEAASRDSLVLHHSTASDEAGADEDDDAVQKSGSTRAALLRIQMKFPALTSDIKAFKASHPRFVTLSLPFPLPTDLSLADFISWYCGGSRSRSHIDTGVTASSESLEEGSYGLWSDLWESCEPEPAHYQKPLFAVEREAEKGLEFLEFVSLDLLSRSLFISGIAAIVRFLQHRMQLFVSSSVRTACVDADSALVTALERRVKSLTALVADLGISPVTTSDADHRLQKLFEETEELLGLIELIEVVSSRAEIIRKHLYQNEAGCRLAWKLAESPLIDLLTIDGNSPIPNKQLSLSTASTTVLSCEEEAACALRTLLVLKERLQSASSSEVLVQPSLHGRELGTPVEKQIRLSVDISVAREKGGAAGARTQAGVKALRQAQEMRAHLNAFEASLRLSLSFTEFE